MFAVTRGELAIVLFILALVWGAGWLPRLGERIGLRLGTRPGRPKPGGEAPTAPASPGGASSAPRDGG